MNEEPLAVQASMNMILRDWFAGMVLQGTMSTQETHEALRKGLENNTSVVLEGLVGLCYLIADAMLIAREER